MGLLVCFVPSITSLKATSFCRTCWPSHVEKVLLCFHGEHKRRGKKMRFLLLPYSLWAFFKCFSALIISWPCRLPGRLPITALFEGGFVKFINICAQELRGGVGALLFGLPSSAVLNTWKSINHHTNNWGSCSLTRKRNECTFHPRTDKTLFVF